MRPVWFPGLYAVLSHLGRPPRHTNGAGFFLRRTGHPQRLESGTECAVFIPDTEFTPRQGLCEKTPESLGDVWYIINCVHDNFRQGQA
jgi:hypothetical protein